MSLKRWEANQFDRLAAGSLAGHLIECGAQVRLLKVHLMTISTFFERIHPYHDDNHYPFLSGSISITKFLVIFYFSLIVHWRQP